MSQEGENYGGTTKKSLPPKKRYKAEVEAVRTVRGEKISHYCVGGTIYPGVIRHTSCPDHCVAYVFK